MNEKKSQPNVPSSKPFAHLAVKFLSAEINSKSVNFASDSL